VSGLGRILVDATGRTLYLFTKDDRSKVTCTGACTSAWPPLVISGHATAGAGVTASLLGTDPGPGGHPVATYGGWPLYTFAGDTAAGQAVGEGLDEFGGHWYAVTPSGTEAGAAASNAPTTTSGAGGY
jgi:predicted lipoprotein with Yx(FWY)xxD motif